MVYGIVKQHEGYITVASEVDKAVHSRYTAIDQRGTRHYGYREHR